MTHLGKLEKAPGSQILNGRTHEQHPERELKQKFIIMFDKSILFRSLEKQEKMYKKCNKLRGGEKSGIIEGRMSRNKNHTTRTNQAIKQTTRTTAHKKKCYYKDVTWSSNKGVECGLLSKKTRHLEKTWDICVGG